LIFACALAGCGGGGGSGGSGLDRSKKLVDLTPAEKQQICDRAPRPQGTDLPGVAACGDAGFSSTINDPGFCLAGLYAEKPGCAATVGDSDDCEQALVDHACDTSVAYATAACQATVACSSSACVAFCNNNCFRADAGVADQCLSSCASFTATAPDAPNDTCASCLLQPYDGSCPDFTTLPSGLDACRSACPGID
jgi:hypothetical protein